MLKLVGFSILLFGTLAGTKANNCSATCLEDPNNTTESCDYTSGRCLHDCKPGLAGPECSFICPSKCLLPEENGAKTCNYITGECLHGCQTGYAGPNCTVECPLNCFPSSISGIKICNATSKECSFGCKVGSYGGRCENRCTDFDKFCKTCSSSVDGSTVCDECMTNYYRDNGKCVKCGFCDNGTNPLNACRESDGYCNYGCITGRYGSKCGIRCSAMCKSTCHRNTGSCLTGCKKPSYCGAKCKDTCNIGCASQRCEQSCVCSDGCIANRWGEQCENFCAETCRKPSNIGGNICYRSNGSCLYGCENDNYFGSQCEHVCSSACVGSVCEQISGKCPNGCNSTKVYGTGCDKACNKDCVDGTCLRSDGYCDRGCVKGSYGDRCHMNCSKNCLDGSCNRKNGYCDFGCSDAFYGKFCENVCNPRCLNRTCDRTSGSCTVAEKEQQGLSAVGAIGVGVIAGLAVISTAFMAGVIVVRIRKVLIRDNRTNMQKLEDLKPESSHSNLACEDDPHHYTSVDLETMLQYETLQETTKEKETNPYERLRNSKEITANSASSASKRGELFGINARDDTNNQAYENLKI